MAFTKISLIIFIIVTALILKAECSSQDNSYTLFVNNCPKIQPEFKQINNNSLNNYKSCVGNIIFTTISNENNILPKSLSVYSIIKFFGDMISSFLTCHEYYVDEIRYCYNETTKAEFRSYDKMFHSIIDYIFAINGDKIDAIFENFKCIIKGIFETTCFSDNLKFTKHYNKTNRCIVSLKLQKCLLDVFDKCPCTEPIFSLALTKVVSGLENPFCS